MEVSPLDTLAGFGLLLVDDHPLFRDSFVMAMRQLANGADLVAVATREQASELLARQADRFDLVLVDYKLPGVNGLVCATELRSQHPDIGFGLISGEDDPQLPQRAREAGLVACLSKAQEMSSLLAALQTLSQGGTAYADFQGSGSLEDAPADFGLTMRQMDVLRLLASGASNKVIAQTLGISPATVKNHLDAIFDKMGVANRLQAVMLARVAVR
jgi:two-component system nitrate/nitrite response regulator NarL